MKVHRMWGVLSVHRDALQIFSVDAARALANHFNRQGTGQVRERWHAKHCEQHDCFHVTAGDFYLCRPAALCVLQEVANVA